MEVLLHKRKGKKTVHFQQQQPQLYRIMKMSTLVKVGVTPLTLDDTGYIWQTTLEGPDSLHSSGAGKCLTSTAVACAIAVSAQVTKARTPLQFSNGSD